MSKKMSVSIVQLPAMKYVLCETFWIQTAVYVDGVTSTPFITLYPGGLLIIEKGFGYDGPSGITYDSDDTYLGALVHDALYRLMQNGVLSLDYKDAADLLFRDLLISQGVYRWRAWAWYYGVKYFGLSSARTHKPEQVIVLKD